MFDNLFRKAANNNNKKNYEELKQQLSGFELGRNMLDWAEANGIKIEIRDQPRGGQNQIGAYSFLNKTMQLYKQEDKALMARVFAHELRHAWQDFQLSKTSEAGLFGRGAVANPAKLLVAQRVIEADAYAFEDAFATQYHCHVTGHEPCKPNIMAVIQARVFGEFLSPDTGEEREFYDRRLSTFFNNASVGYNVARVSRVFAKNDGQLDESAFGFIGNDAWGENNGQRYLAGDSFKMEGDCLYLTQQQKEMFRNLEKIPYFADRNKVKKADGQTVPLLKLG